MILPLSSDELKLIESWRNTASAEQLQQMIQAIQGPPPLWETIVPHRPWPRQQTLLNLDCLEAFYGGAAAGGKSEALLMAALMYIDVPGYSALVLRRDTQRLSLAGGLIPRSQQWLAGKGYAWNGGKLRWTFPTRGAPATLSFGYLRDATDKYRYGSSEFQYIAFDELTEFPEDDYTFLFSRLRRTKGLDVPLRVRSASNPGNAGHAWVKRRFVERAVVMPASAGDILWTDGRAFIPARISDNPAVDEEEYRRTLAQLPLIERERLMNGDWNVQSEGLIRPHWLRRYEMVGRQLRLAGNLQSELSIDERDCRRFVTIDPAGTSAERAAEQRGRSACFTVLEVWDQPRGTGSEHLILREVVRDRVGFDGLCRLIRDVNRQWKPARLLIENEKLGQAAVDVLGRELPITTIATQGRDKIARAARLLVKLERGEIWLPSAAPWLSELENEWLSWTGLPNETSDQIDAAAYAALEADGFGGSISVERILPR